MKTDTREPQAPESYATFWEPLPVDATPAIATAPLAKSAARDAYLEFTNVTEDSPAPLRVERV